jgi:hypothetical protein
MRSVSFETRSLPSSLATTHRGFAFYVAFPKKLHSICRFAHVCRSTPSSLYCISAAPAALDRYLAALPAMSLVPIAPFTEIANDLKR